MLLLQSQIICRSKKVKLFASCARTRMKPVPTSAFYSSFTVGFALGAQCCIFLVLTDFFKTHFSLSWPSTTSVVHCLFEIKIKYSTGYH